MEAKYAAWNTPLFSMVVFSVVLCSLVNNRVNSLFNTDVQHLTELWTLLRLEGLQLRMCGLLDAGKKMLSSLILLMVVLQSLFQTPGLQRFPSCKCCLCKAAAQSGLWDVAARLDYFSNFPLQQFVVSATSL